MGRRSRLLEQQWLTAGYHYEQGTLSLKDLATNLGVHLETLRKGFLRRGVKLRPPHKTIGPTGRKPKYRD
jgi:hypothetical protein